MGTDIDPFIAGLSFGALIGAGPLMAPRFCTGVLILFFVWVVYLLLHGGMSAVEAAALSVLREVAEHRRFALGLGGGALSSFFALRPLLRSSCHPCNDLSRPRCDE